MTILLTYFYGGAGAGNLTPTPVKTANYSAVNGDLVRVDSGGGSFNVTLSASPSDKDRVGVLDVDRSCGTYPVLIAVAGGKTILGDSVGLSLDVNGASVRLLYNSGSNDWVLEDLSSAAVDNTSVNPQWAIKTTGYTAVANDALLADTNGGAFTITLPASPAANDVIYIADYRGTWNTNNLTIARNSKLINGLAENMTCGTDWDTLTLTYIDTTVGWRVT